MSIFKILDKIASHLFVLEKLVPKLESVVRMVGCLKLRSMIVSSHLLNY
jgi:hypothetical protein